MFYFLVFIFYNLCYTFANTSNIECDIEGLCKVLMNSMRFCENGGGRAVCKVRWHTGDGTNSSFLWEKAYVHTSSNDK